MRRKIDRLQNLVSAERIRELTRRFVTQLDPLQVFLFGSFACGSEHADSDYDFYIVMPDGSNLSEASDMAYKSIRFVQDRPVDIVVGTKARFDQYGPSQDSLSVESEVFRKGIILYDRSERTDGITA